MAARTAGRTPGWAAPTAASPSRAPAPGRRSPATAAAVPAHHSGLRSNVRNITELTPCSCGTSMVARWRTTMPIARNTAASTASNTTRPWPTKASSSFRTTATTSNKNNTFVDVTPSAAGLKMVSMSFDPDRVGHRRQMNLRRLILLVGAVVLIVGVIGLLVPVSVPGPDNGKHRVRQRRRCGSVGRAARRTTTTRPTCRYSTRSSRTPTTSPSASRRCPVDGHGRFRWPSSAWW